MTEPVASEPCVFVVWATARPWERAILADLARHFEISAVVELAWRPAVFSRNLTRLYGQALPPGSDKERACGTGPFLVVVVADGRPRYRLRRTTGGLRRVNARAAAAKVRYRRWTGGGFRVHGSLDRREAERDLLLLLGQQPTFAGRRWDGVVRRRAGGEPAEWGSTDELVATIASATPALLVTDEGGGVRVQAEDVWWAAVIAGGDPPDADARHAAAEVRIAGVPRVLELETLAPISRRALRGRR